MIYPMENAKEKTTPCLLVRAVWQNLLTVVVALNRKGELTMKKLFFILAVLSFLPFTANAKNTFNDNDAFVIAKVVKLGRGSTNSFYSSNSLAGNSSGKSELLKTCDKNCASCNTQNGVCGHCKSGYYLKNNVCVTCPGNATCSNGIAFVCNNKYYKLDDSCVAICTNVKCISGTSSKANDNSCCCE